MIDTLYSLGALGTSRAFFLALMLGCGFGFALERAGFSSSRRLAGVFYFTDMAVVKVMFSALLANRARIQVERGAASSVGRRLGYALAGGVLVGFASRLAQGCTSGQALSGGALLLSGSLVFLVCLFASGYAAAWFVRKQWYD